MPSPRRPLCCTAKGLAAGAPVVTAMIGLAELRLDAGDAVGALEAAKRGIKFIFDRNKVCVCGGEGGGLLNSSL